MVALAEKSAKMPTRPPEPPVPVQKVDRRLSADQIAEIVQAYEGDPFGGPVAMRLGVGGSWS
ncbi:hypothetical protein, partial [Mycolicibacterium alvei]|uniref:hypothetical protein n=1 Tax=Mycolicibacterium alvei TaxID=67081 RepID=UPI0031DEEBBB